MNTNIDLIDIADCLPNPYERRQQDVNIDSLAESMTANGLLYPIIVRACGIRKDDQKFEVADGGRRIKAAQKLGWTEIKAIISDLTDDQMQTYATVANLQREGLTTWEEIAEIEYLVNRKTLDIKTIAEKLGKPISWVAKRYRISQAPPEVRTWLEELPDVGVEKLCELCIIDSGALLDLIKSNRDYMLTRSIDGPITYLQKDIATLLNKLNAAPWKLTDETLVPNAGSCAACPYRSGRNPDLFDDTGFRNIDIKPTEKIGKNERCLKPTCWNQKLKAHTNNAIVAAREKHSGLILISDDYIGREEWKAESSYNVTKCKKDDKGALPALHVGDNKAGQIEYVKRHTSSYDKPQKPAAALTEKERNKLRWEKLEQKRQAVAIRLVKEAIEALKTQPAEALGLLLTFGSAERADDARDNKNIWEDFQEYQKDGSPKAYKRIWEMVKPVILERIFTRGCTLDQLKPFYDDAVKLASVLLIDMNQITAAAEKEVPTPKALLNATTPVKKAQAEK